MKIYTKTGDKGITSLYGGTRVPKNAIRIQAYGDVDELNSYLGLIRSYTKQKELDDQLQVIQNSLFDLGAELATPSEKMILANGKPRLACLISEKQISFLEEWIDAMESELPALTQFILPTGCPATSVSHIARTICRRSERAVISLNEQEELRPLCYIYLNRLSDYLFVLARYFGHLADIKKLHGLPMNKALLFINGKKPKSIPEDLSSYSLICCTDGAYTRYVKKFNLTVDFISGDLDSIKRKKVPSLIAVIPTPDQNKTDFHKALELLIKRGIKEVDVYGATGRESDHFIGNLATALFFKKKLKITFYDDFSYFFFSEKRVNLCGVKGKTISLIPFFSATNICTEGLEYPLSNESLTFSERIGTRNKANKNSVTITYTDGELLLYIGK